MSNVIVHYVWMTSLCIYLLMFLHKRAEVAQVGADHGGEMHKRTLWQKNLSRLVMQQTTRNLIEQLLSLNNKQMYWGVSYHFAQENSAAGCQRTDKTQELGKHISERQVMRHFNTGQHGPHLWYPRAWRQMKRPDTNFTTWS